LPTLQLVHAAAAPVLYDPALHARHWLALVAPEIGWYVPAPQLTHALLFMNIPGEHAATQNDPEPSAYFPLAQFSHAADVPSIKYVLDPQHTFVVADVQ